MVRSLWAMAAGLCVAVAAAVAQGVPSAPGAGQAENSSAATVAGGKLHGVVKSGNVPLPGVTVTAQNTLTGKRYTTVTDVSGAWSMTIPQNGRYVVRTQFAGFAQGTGEALLNAQSHEQAVNLRSDAGVACGGTAGAGRRAGGSGGAGDPADGGERATGAEPDERDDGSGAGGRCGGGGDRGWYGAAVDCGECGFCGRVSCGDGAGGAGESAGRGGYGPAAGFDGDDAGAVWGWGWRAVRRRRSR